MKPERTADALRDSGLRSLHELPTATLADVYVSSTSSWNSATWVLDNPTPGASKNLSQIGWDFELPDGRSLLDPAHADLLDWLRRFAWSIFAAPGDNAGALKPASACRLSVGLRYFAAWMVDTGRLFPFELTPEALTEYVDDLKSMRLMRDDDNDEVASEASLSAVSDRLRIPILLWQQRRALRVAGFTSPPREPFSGRGAKTLAKEVTTRRSGWIRPLPDEVALLVMNAAWDFLDVPARDILALQEECHGAYDRAPSIHPHGTGVSVAARQARALRRAKSFRFSCRPGESAPWRGPLKPTFQQRKEYELATGTINAGVRNNRTGDVTLNVMQHVRHLVRDLMHACVLVVQSTTGMRVSEVCGLRAGIDPETGLPSCVRIEDSATGLNELFLIHTRLSKTEATPRSVDWVLGMRPKDRDHGVDAWPPAVQALITLNYLLEPYRELTNTDDLIVSFCNIKGLPKTSDGVTGAKSAHVIRGMRDFAARNVDWSILPDESAQRMAPNDLIEYKSSYGRVIRSHQWRKLFANFTIRVDPGLLPTLQMHFQHVSLAMTEGSYVGSDPSLLNEVESARDQMTALYMWEIAHGKASLENLGHAGDQLGQAISEKLLPRTKAQPADVAWRETVRFSEEFGATFAFSPYATCAAYLLSEMRCHEEAGTKALARWRHNLAPNFAHRRPQLCAGCKNALFDARHRPFWVERYSEYRRAVQRAHDYGEISGLNVFEARMTQARNVLRQLGEDVDRLDASLDEKTPRPEVHDA